ncbi:MAG: cryptochrome/photolyase family protein [Puniceicoccaceae bacterium]
MTGKKPLVVIWHRNDLRVSDHAPLAAAQKEGASVVGLFIWSPEEAGEARIGAAAQWWLHLNLIELEKQYRGADLPFIFRKGNAGELLPRLVEEMGADAVYWNRCYEAYAVKRDADLKRQLREAGIRTESFNSRLLFEPHTVSSGSGSPYRVFTPFWKAVRDRTVEKPIESGLGGLAGAELKVDRGSLEGLGLEPERNWKDGIRASWEPGETGAAKALERFLDGAVQEYHTERDIPAREGTSRLSPYLAVGAIGPRQVWQAVKSKRGPEGEGDRIFLSEIGWREFAHHILFHFPQTLTQPLNERFKNFPWELDRKATRAWQRGRTGYPIVDAGMRQLWKTGWMHNRVRMIAGSLLVKHLLQDWRAGEAWFRDTLIDLDNASNVLGWQWVGGCGADAAPYFRVFNPVIQGEKFDPDGVYVRRWVPELEGVPNRYLHKPWEATTRALGITLGEDYPLPVIEHKRGRERALAAFERVKQ